MKEIIVSPSILSADFTNIKTAIEEIENSSAQWIHCDIMDGVFVPNISFGQKMVGDVRKNTKLVVDAHLMIVNPGRYVEEFAKNGADYITIHYEACDNVSETLSLIKKCGCKAGLAIKPSTEIDVVAPFLDNMDMMLIMSVEPGFSGQKFKQETLGKMRRFVNMRGGRNIVIQGDGGINGDNASAIVGAGCDCLVAGNAFFKSADKKQTVARLKGLI